MFKVGNWIVLTLEDAFNRCHAQNRDITNIIRDTPIKVLRLDSDGDIREWCTPSGVRHSMTITTREQLFFTLHDSSSEYGSFKIILTYIEDGKTIEEEGVTFVSMDHNSIEYKYNRKKLGFIKYKGEVKLNIDELKQITISTPENERVYHIENGVIVREHIMYDHERKFKRFKLGN
ncbi:hypothetical protein FDG95_gp472 [Pectobacterium phage vB_PcaM_CBB]|uniref:Uncharacterized protein n=1 Tax=Pectobacterium phage vB_PcaM_CBB TaxID=2772511 RepID=A0A1L2CVL2_9CAUD|nr:hypothetical protein FDG95_gp472 [Pectobacterium phage vB_PcaM_CBB]AMM44070.1 hypothetical protein CBB_507 [Pectobacterium phage vB_PcaM_CBB]